MIIGRLRIHLDEDSNTTDFEIWVKKQNPRGESTRNRTAQHGAVTAWPCYPWCLDTNSNTINGTMLWSITPIMRNRGWSLSGFFTFFSPLTCSHPPLSLSRSLPASRHTRPIGFIVRKVGFQWWIRNSSSYPFLTLSRLIMVVVLLLSLSDIDQPVITLQSYDRYQLSCMRVTLRLFPDDNAEGRRDTLKFYTHKKTRKPRVGNVLGIIGHFTSRPPTVPHTRRLLCIFTVYGTGTVYFNVWAIRSKVQRQGPCTE